MTPSTPRRSGAHARPDAPLTLPLVGRSTELDRLRLLLDQADAGQGSTVLLTGEPGIGKTRVAREIVTMAARRGWHIASGSAYPVETGMPYAPFADAFLPLFSAYDPAALAVLTRGGNTELAYLFPALRGGDAGRPAVQDNAAEFKARILWNFAQFLIRLSQKHPLLVVIENLHWADPSSLELLHFVARQIPRERVLVLGSYVERAATAPLRALEQSLVTNGIATLCRIEALSAREVTELLRTVFAADDSVIRGFAGLLFGWTRGHPFFIQETLQALIASGRLRNQNGVWLGWEIDELSLPPTVRDAVKARLDRLSPASRELADLAAVVGTRIDLDTLGAIRGEGLGSLIESADELRREGILSETADSKGVAYDFNHPIIRDTLYGELGLARARLLHGTIGEALERAFGDRAQEHAGTLAYHFARADVRNFVPRAARYLSAAGRAALDRYANREAASYLSATLNLMDRHGAECGADTDRLVVEHLAQACQRLGDYDRAIVLWERARTEAGGDARRIAIIERRLGLACYWSGRQHEALAHYDAGLAAATEGDVAGTVSLLIARGMCLQAMGDREAATAAVERALALAEPLGNRGLLARVYRALLLLSTWTGDPDRAREYGERAVALAVETGQTVVACTAHWALAMLAGMSADGPELAAQITASQRLAEQLRSPVLLLWAAELELLYRSGKGEWDEALALGERTIALARALNQRALLPRVLVWTSLIYIDRGDLDRGKRYLDEAWTLSRAEPSGGREPDIHSVVPAHLGLAYHALVTEDYPEAIRAAEAGLAIADRAGYVVWAVHRLLPVLAEAYLRFGNLKGQPRAEMIDRATALIARLRREATRLRHNLGIAWADAGDALLLRVSGDYERAIALLPGAIDRLEAVPFVHDGARLRRELAFCLAETGDRDGAIRELRLVHDIMARLGSAREIEITREDLRRLGARMPPRSAPGSGALTGREAEIVRLVAAHKSNKEIGKALGISTRTVSTHLTHVFEKLGVTSRNALADYAQRSELASD
ncbi:MAG: AAA family ATPase [Gemmatimonadota bacterium]|nr:AAA family ATPase [Gemmatimonadota bacterium]